MSNLSRSVSLTRQNFLHAPLGHYLPAMAVQLVYVVRVASLKFCPKIDLIWICYKIYAITCMVLACLPSTHHQYRALWALINQSINCIKSGPSSRAMVGPPDHLGLVLLSLSRLILKALVDIFSGINAQEFSPCPQAALCSLQYHGCDRAWGSC